MDNLLNDIKSELNINWDDSNTDKKLVSIIKNGKAYLTDIAGVDEIDFTEEGIARSLLFDYCRYRNSHAIEMFEENFRGQLLRLNNKYQAKVFLEGKSDLNENKI
ncbi:hypothetical protein [Terrisporobacter sp.]|uniref:hypothetical protein n=1 Tax=Terrisporobacter sp. TaxID=1965305 RepID=UPI00289F985E|nr:hypothetical protein [Terrisporobacter sp.]